MRLKHHTMECVACSRTSDVVRAVKHQILHRCVCENSTPSHVWSHVPVWITSVSLPPSVLFLLKDSFLELPVLFDVSFSDEQKTSQTEAESEARAMSTEFLWMFLYVKGGFVLDIVQMVKGSNYILRSWLTSDSFTFLVSKNKRDIKDTRHLARKHLWWGTLLPLTLPSD